MRLWLWLWLGIFYPVTKSLPFSFLPVSSALPYLGLLDPLCNPVCTN